MFCPNNVAISGNKAFANLMILTHYYIDRSDGAVQYMRKNAVIESNAASSGNTDCAS